MSLLHLKTLIKHGFLLFYLYELLDINLYKIYFYLYKIMKYNEMKYNGSDLQRLLKETKLVLASLTRRCEGEMKYNGSDFQRLLKETKLVLASLSRRCEGGDEVQWTRLATSAQGN